MNKNYLISLIYKIGSNVSTNSKLVFLTSTGLIEGEVVHAKDFKKLDNNDITQTAILPKAILDCFFNKHYKENEFIFKLDDDDFILLQNAKIRTQGLNFEFLIIFLKDVIAISYGSNEITLKN